MFFQLLSFGASETDGLTFVYLGKYKASVRCPAGPQLPAPIETAEGTDKIVSRIQIFSR
jgi:hypothetical protein